MPGTTGCGLGMCCITRKCARTFVATTGLQAVLRQQLSFLLAECSAKVVALTTPWTHTPLGTHRHAFSTVCAPCPIASPTYTRGAAGPAAGFSGWMCLSYASSSFKGCSGCCWLATAVAAGATLDPACWGVLAVGSDNLHRGSCLRVVPDWWLLALERRCLVACIPADGPQPTHSLSGLTVPSHSLPSAVMHRGVASCVP